MLFTLSPYMLDRRHEGAGGARLFITSEGITMKTGSLAAAAALALSAGAAQASTITVNTFSVSSYKDKIDGFASAVIEDFENPDYAVGNVGTGKDGDGFKTNVGTFWTMGGTGTGGTVAGLDGSRLAVRTGNVFGRSSTTDVIAGLSDNPDDGILDKFLDSNDTFGIRWSIDIGSMFNKLIFVLTDATDVGATMRISATGVVQDFILNPKLKSGNRQLVHVDFGGPVSAAEITFFNSKGLNGPAFKNDGFSIDDVAVSAVPLPAPALMLIAGVAGLAAFRRKRASA